MVRETYKKNITHVLINRDQWLVFAQMKRHWDEITHHNDRWRRERFLLDFLNDAKIANVITWDRERDLTISPLLLDALISAKLNALRHRLLRVRWAFDGAVGDLFDFALVRAFRERAFTLRDVRFRLRDLSERFHGLRVDFENSEMCSEYKVSKFVFELQPASARIVNYFQIKQSRIASACLTHDPLRSE